MTRRACAPLACLLACVLAFACGSHQDVGDGSPLTPDGGSSLGSSSGGGSSGGSGSSGGGSSGAGSSGAGSSGGSSGLPPSPQTVCNALLACAEAQSPSQLGAYQPEYGSTGTCWQTYSASACGASCQQAINLLTSPSITACEFCSSNADCKTRTCFADIVYDTSSGTPYQPCTECDPTWSRCVACLTDADCANGLVCSTEDPTAPGCVQCTKDADCKDPATPKCNASYQQCQACVTNQDCPDPSAPICTSNGEAVGCFECGADTDCATNPAGHLCLWNECHCNENTDCAAGSSCVAAGPDAGSPYGLCGPGDGGV